MFKNSKYKIAAITLLLLSLSMLTWALQRRYFFKQENMTVKKTTDTLHKTFVYDKALLTKFEAVKKKYDSLSKKNYTMAGVINMINKADTAEKMNNIYFLMCKVGNGFYYKLDRTETINAHGLYVFVDNKARKIIVSQQLKVNTEQAGAKLFTDMGAALRSEEYQMTGSLKGTEQTISFTNETHITCKEYDLTYDTTGTQLKHLHVRLTNIQEPSRKDKEKILDVKIAEYNGNADLKKYLTAQDVVEKQDGRWKPVGRFTNYELIIN